MSNKKDYATGTVAVAPSPQDSGLTLELQTGEGARQPATPYFATAHPPSEFPTLDNAEKIQVTDVTGDVLTFTRAEGDTSAMMIDVGWRISNAVFEEDFNASEIPYDNTGSGATADDVQDALDEAFSEIAATNSQIAGLTQDDIPDGSTYVQFSATQESKLSGIEAGADVTDATNVAAAGAVMETDTSTADMDFVVDEDDMASNSDTKLATQQSTKNYVDWSSNTNLLINGNFDVWQRATTFTQNDDLFTADRWNALQEANSSWTIARDTDAPEGSRYSMKFTNVTLNNQVGIVYLMEAQEAIRLKNKKVSLSFQAKTTSSEIANLRCAILTWAGTADSVTSDVVSAWAQNGTDPTWATNWTAENTPSNLALTNSWARYKVENVDLNSATINNIAIVIWVDDGTIAANDDFWLSQVQLNIGEKAVPFQFKPYADEFARCIRYYQHYVTPHMVGVVSGTAPSRLGMPIPTMRVAPTCTFGAINLWDGGTVATLSSVTVQHHTPHTIEIDCTASAGMTAGRAVIGYSGSSSAIVTASAEL